MALSRNTASPNSSPSFTLVEMLVVIAIIALLAGLVLIAGTAVLQKAARSRAVTEIQAMSTALDSYKTDNGIYPVYYNAGLVTNYSGVDPAATGASAFYLLSSETLYFSLSGQTNFLDAPVPGNKAYMSFRANQLGNLTAGAVSPNSTYVRDPFQNSYGYSTGASTSNPYSGFGFFDLWSSGGKTGTAPANTNSFISNWQ